MEYSGILIAARPEAMDEVRRAVDGLEAFEVHRFHPEEGRMIAVQEAATNEASKEGLRRIQALPGVLFAELVYHLVDEHREPHEGE
ncbi:MAG: chaperone NapD [Deltaproteobacteria bacterium]|nr:chaperone NapD [Deltaproteobacteria bacterium]